MTEELKRKIACAKSRARAAERSIRKAEFITGALWDKFSRGAPLGDEGIENGDAEYVENMVYLLMDYIGGLSEDMELLTAALNNMEVSDATRARNLATVRRIRADERADAQQEVG